MLTRYVVTYDIRDPKRLRKVFKCLRNYGEHLQFSVFDCLLSEKDLVRLRADLSARIDGSADQVLLVKLGPADGRAADAIEFLGVKVEAADRVVKVL
jgi:CRISPR-associated protein Cas2